MDTKAWPHLRDDPLFEKAIDLRREGQSFTELGIFIRDGLTYRGRLGQLDIYTLFGNYVDEAGATQKLLPDYTALLGSARIEGVRHFGAILDERAGYQAMAYFPSSWLENDPAFRMIMVQSASLTVPYRVNASVCITVR